MCGAYDAGCFELVHDAAGAVVADGEVALEHGGGALLVGYDHARGFFEEFVASAEVDASYLVVGVFSFVFGQEVGCGVALLVADVADYLVDFGGVDKGALYSDWFVALEVEHVAFSDELLCSGAVEDGAGVHHGGYAEGYSGGEVGFDCAGDDVGGGALGGDDGVDADGSGELRDSADGEFDFFAGCHDEVAKFVDDDDDVGHEVVAFFGVELAVDEFFVVFLYVSTACLFEQVVAGVHFDAEGVEGADDLVGLCDDGFFCVGEFGQVVVFYWCVDGEFYFLGVDDDEFEL